MKNNFRITFDVEVDSFPTYACSNFGLFTVTDADQTSTPDITGTASGLPWQDALPINAGYLSFFGKENFKKLKKFENFEIFFILIIKIYFRYEHAFAGN